MSNLPNIMITGLTGQSGAGKSTVCRVFSDSGFYIIDCDANAKKAASRKEFLDEIKTAFGEKMLLPDGSLDRKETARMIFSDKEKKGVYCSIIFPYIIYDILRDIEGRSGDILLDAPTLFESGLDMICGRIVSVAADADKCAERISFRDKITPDEAKARLLSQHKADFFRERSEYTIENNGSVFELYEKTKAVIDRMKG